jgi:hypothetical protein
MLQLYFFASSTIHTKKVMATTLMSADMDFAGTVVTVWAMKFPNEVSCAVL